MAAAAVVVLLLDWPIVFMLVRIESAEAGTALLEAESLSPAAAAASEDLDSKLSASSLTEGD